MNNKGVTLIELLIVIVVVGIVSAFGIVAVGDIIKNTSDKVDNYNAEYIADKMELLFDIGTLEIKNNKVYNNKTSRSYSGTGKAFYKDLEGSIGNRIIPVTPESQNDYNKTNDGVYKFWFKVDGDIINIYYWDSDKVMVIIAVIDLS